MDTGVLCNKEMVDLLMRIKRHAKASYGISISMSDRDLMIKLLEMGSLKDDLLQGMLQYFMALAGGDWASRYARVAQLPSKAGSVQVFAQKVKDSLLKDVVAAADGAAPAVPAGHSGEQGKVRYYRGQPVYG